MAWVTTIGADPAQVEYRLAEECGCDRDTRIDYRTEGDVADLTWIGGGLREVGLVKGEPVDKDAARAIMAGLDPRDGAKLLRAKVAADPRSKLPPGPLIAAVRAAAEQADVSVAELLVNPKLVDDLACLARGVAKKKDAHRVAFGRLDAIATAANVALDDVYPFDDVDQAREYAGKRVRTGNRGYDLVLDLGKTYSAAVGLAPPELAVALEQVFLQAAGETVEAVESWVSYAMTGHHGDGQTATRVQTSGLLGWMTVHRTARPVDGTHGDPHLHVHLNFANMVRATGDGKWRVFGGGGRDLHRHARAADSFVKARLRTLTAQKFGMRWERHQATGAWEVVGIDERVRQDFSRRSTEAIQQAGADASTAEKKLAGARSREAKRPAVEVVTDVVPETEAEVPEGGEAVAEPEAEPDTDVRAEWRERASRLVDVDAMIRAAVPGGPGMGPVPPWVPPLMPSPLDIAARVLDPENGLTSKAKVFSRADLLASVVDAVPVGLVDVAQAEDLVDRVLEVAGYAVRLPDQGQTHMSHPERYTSRDVLDAEQVIEDSALARFGEGAAALTPEQAALAVATTEAGQDWAFSTEQRAALARLLTGGHGVDALIGVAGAGKTTLMSCARAGWEAAGLTVAGAALAAVAAANLDAEAGIVSHTLARRIEAIRTGTGLAGIDVLVVDEAAMCDDRTMAELLAHAATTGTKIVAVGDPLQLKAVGVGGGFAEIHRLVGGASLTENRRQVDPVERDALADWRTGARRDALGAFADAGHVHAVDTPEQAHADMLAAWDQARRVYDDPHDALAGLLLLAARNTDVDTLNHHARAGRRASGELGPETMFAGPDGTRLGFAVGDLVRVRRNDYRSRSQDPNTVGPDVLNGFRGVVTATGPGGVSIEWRRPSPDGGHHLERADLTRVQIAEGALSHGYAMTVAAAQGLTCDIALTYGPGADAHTLYPALSRAREATHLWLPIDVLEDDATRARLGDARTPGERLHRAVDAYAAGLEHDRPDTMVGHELREPAEPAPAAPEPASDRLRQARESLARVTAALGRGEVLETMRARPHGTIPTGRLVPDAEEAEARAARTEQAAADRVLAADVELVQAREGEGPCVRKLLAEREKFVPAAQQQARADWHRERGDAYTGQAADARSRAFDLTRQQGLGRIALWRAGTSRAELQTAIDAAREQAEAAQQAAAVERREQHTAEQEVRRLRPSYANPLTRLAEMDRDWATLHGDAHRADVEHAERTVTRDGEQARAEGRAAAADRETARGLREEAALRTELPADRLAVEDTHRERIEERRLARAEREREQRAERRREQQQRQQEYHRRPPTPGGPGGHGISM